MNCLLADIGGTNTRCAVTSADGEIQNIRLFRNCEFSDLTSLLETYLQNIEVGEPPRQGVLAVAAPIRGDFVHMINIQWAILGQQPAKPAEFPKAATPE